MTAPRNIIDAERDVHRALIAARSLGATAAHGLETAEHLLAEVRHFSLTATDSGHLSLDACSRLLSAVLGFEVRVTGTRAGRNDIEAHKRLAA